MSHAALTRRGRIAAIDADRMQVVFEAPPACGGCGGRALCQGASAPARVSLPLRAGARAGDVVEIAIAPRTLHAAAALAWLAPAASLIAGALAGQLIGASERGAMLGAGLGLALGLALSALLARALALPEARTPTSCPPPFPPSPEAS